MHMTKARVLVALGVVVTGGLIAGGAARAGAHPAAAAPPAELQLLAKLVGTWQGSAKMGDKTVPVTFVYESTAGGSAIVEHLFPGTPHEMMSVYTAEGDGLAMTHYCAMGNHPKMVLKKSDARGLSFEMVKSDGLRSAAEPHMHAMSVSWTDADHIREVWTSFDKGKANEEKVFELARKK
jgi:hypothetical protein